MELKQFFLNILRFGAVAGAGAAKMGRHGVASFLTFSKIYTIPNSFIKILRYNSKCTQLWQQDNASNF